MQEAQAKSSKSEESINKFAKFYTPAVLLVSFFLFIVPLIINKVDEVGEKMGRSENTIIGRCLLRTLSNVYDGAFLGRKSTV